MFSTITTTWQTLTNALGCCVFVMQERVEGSARSAARRVLLDLLLGSKAVALVNESTFRALIISIAATGYPCLRTQMLVSVSQSNVESVVSDIVARKAQPALCFVFIQVTGCVAACLYAHHAAQRSLRLTLCPSYFPACSNLSVMDIARLVQAAQHGSVRVVILADRLVLHALSVTNKTSSVLVLDSVREGLQSVGDAANDFVATG